MTSEIYIAKMFRTTNINDLKYKIIQKGDQAQIFRKAVHGEEELIEEKGDIVDGWIHVATRKDIEEAKLALNEIILNLELIQEMLIH